MRKAQACEKYQLGMKRMTGMAVMDEAMLLAYCAAGVSR
jgi:hypothetical protein